MTIDMIRTAAMDLDEESLDSVFEYIQFLLFKKSKKHAAPKKGIASLYGIYEGKGWISDDFDEPLEDFKEYM